LFLPFQVSIFTKSNCRDFFANNEWPPINRTSIHWIIRFIGNAGVLSQAATEAVNSCRVSKCTSVDLVSLTGESSLQQQRLPQATAGMVDILFIYFEHIM